MNGAFEFGVAYVLHQEGGYKPETPDGDPETNMGISKRANPDIDVKNITVAIARAVYATRYWDALNLDALPYGIAVCAFDAAVSQGQGIAPKMLQEVLGVVVDGQIGPLTAGAARSLPKEDLLQRYCARRAIEYGTAKNYLTYKKPWYIRLFETYDYCEGIPT